MFLFPGVFSCLYLVISWCLVVTIVLCGAAGGFLINPNEPKGPSGSQDTPGRSLEFLSVFSAPCSFCIFNLKCFHSKGHLTFSGGLSHVDFLLQRLFSIWEARICLRNQKQNNTQKVL